MQVRRGTTAGALAVVLAACGASPPRAVKAEQADEPTTNTTCAVTDPAGLAACVDADRYEAGLFEIAGSRPPGSTQWRAVQSYCDQTLTSLGFEVERHAYETGINVVGTRRGTTEPERMVVVGAHYDHIAGCEGADDNASGVAGVLEVARVLASTTHDRTLVVACWDEEERGLLGSRAWVGRAQAQSTDVVVYFNFDAIAFSDPSPNTQRIPPGFGVLFPREVEALEARERRADFITVVADEAGRPFVEPMIEAAARLGQPQSVLTIPTLVRRSHLAADLERSDHASFWRAGYPAVMITDTADYRSERYHCRGAPDVVESLDLPFAVRVVRATTRAVAEALHAPPGAGPGA